VVNGKTEWSQEDFARVFLSWLVMADPNYRNGWVWFPDIRKHLFKRFKAEAGCRYLQLGALVLGLGSVTLKREMAYADITGRRWTATEYWVGEG
jgi:hypothetical protein